MNPVVGDIVYCVIPIEIDYPAIAMIENIQGDTSLRVVILHSEHLFLYASSWNCSPIHISINFGQTNLDTIRQTHPELFI